MERFGMERERPLTYVVLLTPRMEGENSPIITRVCVVSWYQAINPAIACDKMVSSGVLDENWQPVNDTDWDALSAKAKTGKGKARAESDRCKQNSLGRVVHRWFVGDDCIVSHAVPFTHYDKLRENTRPLSTQKWNACNQLRKI